jgi:hypothetical protein
MAPTTISVIDIEGLAGRLLARARAGCSTTCPTCKRIYYSLTTCW